MVARRSQVGHRCLVTALGSVSTACRAGNAPLHLPQGLSQGPSAACSCAPCACCHPLLQLPGLAASLGQGCCLQAGCCPAACASCASCGACASCASCAASHPAHLVDTHGKHTSRYGDIVRSVLHNRGHDTYAQHTLLCRLAVQISTAFMCGATLSCAGKGRTYVRPCCQMPQYHTGQQQAPAQE